MSMDYWMVFGLGFDDEDLMPYLDTEKLRKLLAKKQKYFSAADAEQWEKADRDGKFVLLEAYADSTFGFMDLLAESEERSLLSYGNDGDNGHYLYYEPSYPWKRKEHECQSEEEAREYLCDVVIPFVMEDTPREDILGLIYQINQVGIS